MAADSPAPARAAKAALRRALRTARSRPAEDERADAERLADLVCALPEVAGARRVAAYVARSGEPSTSALLDRWRASGLPVLLPVVLPDLDLDWALDDALHAPGLLPGVHEPGGERLGVGAVATADVVVVPALAVDRNGHRLGQGGGSYDRALARARGDAVVVALVHPEELLDEDVPVEPHDRPVDVVVTVEGVLRFGARRLTDPG